MASWPQDPWFRDREIIKAEKLFAIGYMALIWNNAEFWAFELFRAVSGMRTSAAWIVANDIGDTSMWKKTIDLAEIQGLSHSVIDDINFAERCYDICRRNRNQFVHVNLVAAGESDGSALRLGRKKGPKLHGPILDDDLATIQRACEDIERVQGYVGGLAMALHFDRMRLDGRLSTPRSSWPQRPPEPALVWAPPRQNQPKPRRRPRSSPA